MVYYFSFIALLAFGLLVYAIITNLLLIRQNHYKDIEISILQKKNAKLNKIVNGSTVRGKAGRFISVKDLDL